MSRLWRTDHRKKKNTTSGSLISVLWECEQGQKWQWNSCPDVRGIPSNNLLVSVGTVITGSTYAGISEWAAVLNLQVPHKTTFYAIQSSYLIPAIDEVFKEQQTALLEHLKAGSTEKKGNTFIWRWKIRQVIFHVNGEFLCEIMLSLKGFCYISMLSWILGKVHHIQLDG